MKLRKCICGSVVFLSSGIYGDDLRFVECENCGLASLQWCNGNKAASNWNAIIRKNNEQNKCLL